MSIFVRFICCLQTSPKSFFLSRCCLPSSDLSGKVSFIFQISTMLSCHGLFCLSQSKTSHKTISPWRQSVRASLTLAASIESKVSIGLIQTKKTCSEHNMIRSMLTECFSVVSHCQHRCMLCHHSPPSLHHLHRPISLPCLLSD